MRKLFSKKALALMLGLTILISSISFLLTIGTARGDGLVVGQSYTISSDGIITGSSGLTWIDEVVFELGLSRDKDTYLAPKDGEKIVKSKFTKKFINNVNNTVWLMNRILYDTMVERYGKFTVGWYNSGSKTLQTEGQPSFLDRLKILNTSPTKPTNGVYYGVLTSLNYNRSNLSTLSNGAWKTTILNKKSISESTNAISYIFQKLSNEPGTWKIEERFKEFLNSASLDINNVEGWSDAVKEEQKLRMLDLLMVCYNVMPDNATNKKDWEVAIEDWISGADLKEKPITLAVTTAVVLNPGQPALSKTGGILVRTIDYLNYSAGVESKYRLNSGIGEHNNVTPQDPGRSGLSLTYNNLTGSVNQSIAASPTFKRITDAYNGNNGFSRGLGAMARWRLSTSGSRVSWKDTDVTASYLDTLKITDINCDGIPGDDVSGFMLVLAPPVSKQGFSISLAATPDGEVLDSKKETINNVVTLKIGSNTSSELVSSWGPVLDSAKTNNKLIEVTFTIDRTPAGGRYTPDYINSKKTFTPDEFLTFLQGNSIIQLTDDDTSNIQIAMEQTVEINYKVTMRATINGETLEAEATDKASFRRPLDDITIVTYYSDPSTYSELKEGSPYNESFEAMAGVPSTETLYFAAGGSEFIAEVEIEYVRDATSTRKYRSYYTGTDCEFKARDTAGSYNVGGNLVNAHSGGTTSKSWSGSIPWTGTATASGWHGGGVTNSWDYSAQQAALAEAQAWATLVNGTVISHTAGSDGQTRTFSSWGASVQGGYTNGTPATWTDGKDPIPAVPASGTPGEPGYDPGKPAVPGVPAKCTQGTAGSYSYTVVGTLPAHRICGPCCNHVLPEVNDTWTQDISFDHMKINSVHIWKIDQASINGMREITGTDEIKASIVSGDPNIFYNIAEKNNPSNPDTSEAGRLRYSVEPKSHDSVVWNEGTRTNKCNGLGSNPYVSGNGHSSSYATGILYNNTAYPNEKDYEIENSDAKDKNTTEYAKFKSRRETQNIATVISDVLILQTSSGDQSIIYFQKDSVSKQTQENFPKVEVALEEMWDNNPNSAAKWNKDKINIGSYNGNYRSPSTKYQGSGNNSRVATKFDSDPAGSIVRPSRPSQLFLYKNNISQIITNVNKSYITGTAETFWKSILDYPTTTGTLHERTYISKYGAYGYVEPAPYSPSHSKVNNIVVHDPVSAQDAIIVGLEKSRDQRSTMPIGSAEDSLEDLNRYAVCPRDPGLCEFRVLNCTYFQDSLLANFDFEDGTGIMVNKVTEDEYVLPSGFTIENINRFGTGRSLSAKGTRLAIPLSDLGFSYNPSVELYIEADMHISSSDTLSPMLFSFNAYDLWLPAGYDRLTWNTGNGLERQSNTPITNRNVKIGAQFNFSNLDRNKLFIDGVEETNYTRHNDSNPINANIVGDVLYIGSWGNSNSYGANFYLDNLKIIRRAGSTEHNESCYKPIQYHVDGLNAHIHTADCLESTKVKGEQVAFSYTGNYQIFTAPTTGEYTLEVWGAQGGNATYSYSSGMTWYHTSGCTYAGETHTTTSTSTCTYCGHNCGYLASYGGSYTNTATGGLGGYSKGNIQLKAGDSIYIYVGGQGTSYSAGTTTAGGWNGGGNGYYYSGGGGGGTDIRINGQSLSNRVIVAGGGGGAQVYPDNSHAANGGAGGGINGGNGQTHGIWTSSYANYGGSQSAGGTATSGWSVNGSTGQGGNHYSSYTGGGGGGYYGGAAGAYHGYSGAGGSGYIGGVTEGTMSNGVRTGNGRAVITVPDTPTDGASWVINGIKDGSLTDEQLRDILGEAYEEVMKNSYGPAIHTWSGWDTSNMMEFSALKDASLSTLAGDLIQTINGNDPQLKVPVNFEAEGVSKIELTIDNNTSSTLSQLFWSTISSTGFSESKSIRTTMKANKDNQVIDFVVRGHNEWKGTINNLRFDIGTTTGTIKIKSISIYGGGTKTIGESSSTGTVVWESGAPGAHTFNAPAGTYKLEVWGAQGGDASVGGSYSTAGGKGGYATGEITLTGNRTAYIYVGGKGTSSTSTTNSTKAGGFNGGGNSPGGDGNYVAAAGGGATDIRLDGTALGNRIIVAGGGGGAGTSTSYPYAYGGYGGGSTGGTGTNVCSIYSGGYGGTQSAGGTKGTNSSCSQNGTSGQGGHQTGNSGGWSGGGGGGGYFGGGSGGAVNAGGGGGSGYIGGVSSGQTINGDSSMPNPSGGNMIGKSGNGYARITSLAEIVTITHKSALSTNQFTPVLWNGLGYTYNGSSTRTVGTIQASHVGKTLVIATANGNDETNTNNKPVVSSPLTQVGIATQGRAWYKAKITSADVGRVIQISGSMSSWGYIAYFIPDGWDLTQVVSSTTTTISISTSIDTVIMSNLAGVSNQNGYTAWNTNYGSLLVYMKQFNGGGNSFPVPVTTAWHNTNSPHAIFTRTYSSGVQDEVLNYNYTGGVQTVTLQKGTYQVELWGAQGGNDGAKGTYVKDIINIANDGELVRIYVGGQGTTVSGAGGGWNGGGNNYNGYGGGGGATDIRIGGTALSNRVVVAGGGGGKSHTGVAYETHDRYTLGNGQNATSNHTGGGGGGYYGGTTTNNSCSSSSYSGSAYAGGAERTSNYSNGDIVVTYGNKTGDGQARITLLSKPEILITVDDIKEHWNLIPNTLPDGSYNPIWACGNILGVSSTVGLAFESATKAGSGVYDVVYPGTSTTRRTVRLDAGYTVPVISTDSMALKANTEYVLEFDYWADADNVKFDVDIWPEDLPQILPIANKAVQHYKWEFSSSSTNMQNAKVRIFNDVTTPNPANIYVTNIRLVEKSYYNIHICNSNCYEANILTCSEPHHSALHYDGSNDICWDACNNDANHKFYKPTITTPTGNIMNNATFINIDWEFQVYFPNTGDFDQGQALGISSIVTSRGKGFTNNMDTSKWIRKKRVKFSFNVIYEGDEQLYRAGEWIELPIKGSTYPYYNFYCVLANSEAKSADVEFEVEAINCSGNNDNIYNDTNRNRYSDFTALHGAYKTAYVDVVGRIGNLVIDDTGDYRFSNFFKAPVVSNDWIVDGVVKKVNSDLQNLFFAYNKDIRGVDASTDTGWLNTYGTQPWLNKEPTLLPLSPEKNNIKALRTQPLRPGYDILADISTIGNYQKKMQIVPYYYALDLINSTLTPVDVYIATNDEYSPINIHNFVQPNWDSTKIYKYIMNLDWVDEAARRNYGILEKSHTDALSELYAEDILTPDIYGEMQVTGSRNMDIPVGKYYSLGTAQLLSMSGRARTFIGSEYTNGVNMNIGNKIDPQYWWYAAQRWHFKTGLPSSAVFVENGKRPTAEEVTRFANGNHVILIALDIQAVGDTFVLRYNQENNGTINLGGRTYTMPANIPPVFAVYSANRSAVQDVDIRKTH